MNTLFQRLIDGDLAKLSGLAVDATITVSEALANELISLALHGNPQVEYCRIQIHAENRTTLNVKSPLWPWPLQLKLKLFGSVDMTHSPTIRAFLENHVLLGKLSALFNALPKGIKIYEDQIAIDIGAFVDMREQKFVWDLIKSAEIRTQEARILLDIALMK